MIGSIIGDFVGFHLRGRGLKSKDFNFIEPFCTFTDDTEYKIAFLEVIDFDDTILYAISIGGDTDTLACIRGGGITQAYYEQIPSHIIKLIEGIIPIEFYNIINEFNAKFNI